MNMTFWQALKSTYRGSAAFIVACPMLALVPVFFEIVQHIVETRHGMYDSIAGFRAAGSDSMRLGFGFVKIVALTLPNYWIDRFLASRDASFAKTIDRAAVRLFVPFLVVQLAFAAVQLFAVPQSAWAFLASLVVGQVFNCLLLAWGVAAALGSAAVGPRVSVAIMIRRLPWTFVFTWVAVLPLMVPHYVLGSLAIGRGAWVWPILITDALLVGWLSAVSIASTFFAATRAAGMAGVTLAPSSSPTSNSL